MYEGSIQYDTERASMSNEELKEIMKALLTGK